MKTKFLIWLIFILAIFVPAAGQNELDSLRQIIKEHTGDTVEIDAINELSGIFYYTKPDSSRLLAEKAEKLSKQINYKKGLSYAYHNLGANFSIKSEYDSALTYYEKSLALAIEMGDSARIPGKLTNLGRIFYVKGNYRRSLDYYQKALKLKIKFGMDVSTPIMEIGSIYYEQKNFDQCLKYYNQALKLEALKPETDFLALIPTLNNIGIVYIEQENYQEALSYLLRAFNMGDSLSLKCRQVTAATNIGICYQRLDQLDLALNYLSFSYENSKICNMTRVTGLASQATGEIHAKMGLTEQAESELLESYRIAENQRFKFQMKDASDALYNFYKSVGNISQALKFLEINSKVKYELSNEDLTEQLTTMELNFAFQQERDSLEYQKQKELLVINASLERQHIFKYLTSGGLLLASIFVFILYRNYRLKQLANLNLRKKNEIQQEKLRIEASVRKQLEIENNQKSRALIATSMQLLNFNEKLSDVIAQVRRNIELPDHQQLKMIKELDSLRNEEDHWNNIRVHFENVHPDFFRKLELHFPDLSPNDYKILTYLKMKLSNKEIAIILNVTTRAVEQSKRRLKKKLGMESDDNDIIAFINQHTMDRG